MFETLKTFFQSAGQTLAALQPPFFRRMKASYRAATVILVIVVLWIASGVGHHATTAVQAKTSTVPSVCR